MLISDNKLQVKRSQYNDKGQIQAIIKDYAQLYANKLDNTEERDKFLETYNLQSLNHKEKIWTDQLLGKVIESVI